MSRELRVKKTFDRDDSEVRISHQMETTYLVRREIVDGLAPEGEASATFCQQNLNPSLGS
jgi:hypothetical protein